MLFRSIGRDNIIGAIRSLINVHAVKYHAQLVDQALLAEIKGYLPCLKIMKQDRDYIVHSMWSKANETSLSRLDFAATARSGLDFSAGVCPRIEPVEEFAQELEKAATLLWELGARIPTIQPASLKKLHELETDNRRDPATQSVRQVQPRSFAQLQREPPPRAKQPKSKRAKA